MGEDEGLCVCGVCRLMSNVCEGEGDADDFGWVTSRKESSLS